MHGDAKRISCNLNRRFSSFLPKINLKYMLAHSFLESANL
jgi:hypothetical protein